MTITDAQVHIYGPNAGDTAWPDPAGRGNAPAKHANGFSAEEMLEAMQSIGVDRAVIVPPVWAGENNTPALAAAAKYAGKFAVMGRIDPYNPEAPRTLDQWLKQPNMLGIRMSGRWGTTTKTSGDVFEDPEANWYWAACESLRIPIMLLTMQNIAKVASVAKKHPNLTLIIDHLSTVNGNTAAEAFAAYDEMIALAQFPRVLVKVGNGPNRSTQPFPYEDVHGYLKGVYDAFGPRRMLWEADITQLTKDSYEDCLRLWTEGLPFLTAEDKDWILGRSTAEALTWPE